MEQREDCCDVVLLQDYPDKVVRLDCRYCDRTGRYGLAGLVQRFGAAAGLAGSWSLRCGLSGSGVEAAGLIPGSVSE